MTKAISWKVLLPTSIVLWVLGGQTDNVIVGGFLALIGFILFIISMINLKRSFKKTK